MKNLNFDVEDRFLQEYEDNDDPYKKVDSYFAYLEKFKKFNYVKEILQKEIY